HRENISFSENQEKGVTVVYVAADGEYAGRIIISDTLKPDAAEAVERLHKNNIKTVILTGDTRLATEAMAKRLKIDRYFPELMPEDKVKHIEMLMKESSGGKTAFAGDGINDAPVLARADVGIAMGALGSDAAVETADVVLMTDSPLKVAEAIDVAKKTRVVVWQNIFFALGVKLIFIVLGIAGIATMWEAVFGDMGVALLAVFNAMRVLRSKQT
ncbi:MAG: HAD-IC family P-type ATPase, partial [Bacteroidota bacterium]